ncbi:MAG: hypothetical protein EA357_07595 [Micavibrio sp.]|jgi:hypothetical protein|nr:MAG: hypothetical protein EA357_07595 [Micavibrio sp.]
MIASVRLYVLCILVVSAVALPSAAFAAKQQRQIPYFSDPVYEPLYEDAEHPLDMLIELAEDGDARAQFIMGDLYAKGKGGFPKDEEQAQHWFEESARNDYLHGFIRLAAMAERRGDMGEAYQWYSLGESRARRSDSARHLYMEERLAALKEKLQRDEIREAERNARDWRRGGPRITAPRQGGFNQ